MNVGRLLNNLGGLQFLLGKPDEAIKHLKDAFARRARARRGRRGRRRAISSLAQVHLRTGKPVVAEEQARQALRAARRPGGRARGERQRKARARPRAARAGTARRGRAGARRGGGRAGPAVFGESQRGSVGGARATSHRSGATTLRQHGSTAVPPRRYRTSGSRSRHRKGGDHVYKVMTYLAARRGFVLASLSVASACSAHVSARRSVSASATATGSERRGRSGGAGATVFGAANAGTTAA